MKSEAGPRLSWRKERGLPRRWRAYVDGKHLATCEEVPGGLWFWYGLGRVAPSDPASIDYCRSEISAVVHGAKAQAP
jgi:hypothetical protein